jgi:tetratricopeptide (TPR) repeat protein
VQSAFWLVDGSYQSYEQTGFEVELALRIQRIFGASTERRVRDKPGEPLFKNVKREIDDAMAQLSRYTAPTRLSEIRAQMITGRDLSKYNPRSELLAYAYTDERTPQRKRNLEEAIRAFKTVLLLDPHNREAKIYLGYCLRSPTLQRFEEARQYYREVFQEPVQDEWSEKAKQGITATFFGPQ